MAQCKQSMLVQFIAHIFMVFFCIPLMVYSLYGLFWIRGNTLEMPGYYLLGVLMFGGLLCIWIYRIFWLGPMSITYNEKIVVFKLSRKDRREFQWVDFINAGISVTPSSGYIFLFPDKKKLPISPFMKGFKELEHMLYNKGIIVSNWVEGPDFQKKNAIFKVFLGMMRGEGLPTFEQKRASY